MDFTLPPEWADLGDALWRTPRASRHLGQVEGETLDAVELGHRLYDAVFAGEVGTSLVRNLERADNRCASSCVWTRDWLDWPPCPGNFSTRPI